MAFECPEGLRRRRAALACHLTSTLAAGPFADLAACGTYICLHRLLSHRVGAAAAELPDSTGA